MSLKLLPECSQTCYNCESTCPMRECKYWINYEAEQNCSLISAYTNGPMTLKQIAERIGLSLVRISQIEKKAIQKLTKKIKI
jgi:hypothetical protein